MSITVFTGPGCGGCVTAKAHLRKRGIAFEEVAAAEYADILRGLGLIGLPVILAGDEDVISGYASEDIEWMLRHAVPTTMERDG